MLKMALDWTHNGEDREKHCVTALQEIRGDQRGGQDEVSQNNMEEND